MPRGMQGPELSTDPRAVRARLRRKDRKIGRTEDQMLADVEMLPRYKDVTEWDFEELARGKPRCADGSFKGPAPRWLTPVIRKEATRRLGDMTRAMLATQVESAVTVMTTLMTDDERDEETGKPIVPATVKMDAAKFIIEQTIGKAKQRVDIEAGESVQDFLAQFSGGIVNRDGSAYRPRRGQRVITETGEDVDEGG